MARKHNSITRYWGYLLFIVLITAWWTAAVGPAGLLLLSAVCVLYFTFQAPVWCGADVRDGAGCRNNSTGVLMGCHLRQHKWQLLKGVAVSRSWRELNRRIWADATTGIASVSAIAASVSGVAATVQVALGH